MAIYVDEVHCNNCETNHRVDVGEDVCPNCDAEGTLMWLNEPTEVVGEPGPIDDEE